MVFKFVAHLSAGVSFSNGHISSTPGVIWLTAPTQANNNPDVVIAPSELRFSSRSC